MTLQIASLIFLPVIAALILYIFYLYASQRDLNNNINNILDNIILFATGISLLFSVILCFSWIAGYFTDDYIFQIKSVFITGLSFQVTGFRAVYSFIASFMWFFTALFSREYFQHERQYIASYYAFYLITLGATQGLFLSADFMTAFIFFEILSLTSFTWVAHERTQKAIHAGYVYLFTAIIGGLILLTGLLFLYHETKTLYYTPLTAYANYHNYYLTAAAICIVLGFGAKAGLFPLHIWLPMAHPVAPSPASALLSGILTKVGVFGVLMLALSYGASNITLGFFIFISGLITMTLGAILAIFSVCRKSALFSLESGPGFYAARFIILII